MGVERLTLEGLVISHPEMQPGLTAIIPAGEQPSHYINRYEADHDVRCAFCDKHTPHRKGFTVKMKDGRTALCGRDCARHYFGDEIADNFEKKLEEQIRRASKRKVVQRTLLGVHETISALPTELVLMEEQALAAVAALSSAFSKSKLTGFTDSGHYRLKETRRTWIEKEDGVGKTVRVPVDTEHLVLEVRGAVLLATKHNGTSKLLAALKDLHTLASADTSKEFSDTVIDRMAEMRSRALRNITDAMQFLDLSAQLLTHKNVKALSDLTQHVRTHVERIDLRRRGKTDNLVITPHGWINSKDFFGGPQRVIVPVPDFGSRPNLKEVLRPLKDGNTNE